MATTLIVVGVSITYALPFVAVPRQLLRYANLLRMSKLFALLLDVSPDFRFLVSTLVGIFIGAADVMLLVFVWTAIYSVAGVQLFGGLIYAGNKDLSGTLYFDSVYDSLNFNDFAMGFYPFITMLVAAGPQQPLTDGFSIASGNVFASRFLFWSYYYVAQLIILNVFISYVISAYALRKEQHAARLEAAARRAAAREDNKASGAGDAKAKSADEVDIPEHVEEEFDETQLENLRSFFALNAARPDEEFEVVPRTTGGQDTFLRRLYADDIQKAVSEADEL